MYPSRIKYLLNTAPLILIDFGKMAKETLVSTSNTSNADFILYNHSFCVNLPSTQAHINTLQ
jgi:hypothetical protein